jgi:hypothetical protein
MAFILWKGGEEAIIDTFLNGAAVTPSMPGLGSNFGLGLAATVGGVWAGANSVSLALTQRGVGTDVNGSIAEIGQIDTVNNGGYARIPMVRGTGAWPAAANNGSTDHYFTAASQQTFSFSSGGPNLGGGGGSNPTTLWFLAKSVGPWSNVSTPVSDLLFGSDLSQPRPFQSGDIANIIPGYKQQSS